MSPDNLGIVWGPTLLREEKENFLNMDLPVAVIVSLIKYCDELFEGEVGPMMVLSHKKRTWLTNEINSGAVGAKGSIQNYNTSTPPASHP